MCVNQYRMSKSNFYKVTISEKNEMYLFHKLAPALSLAELRKSIGISNRISKIRSKNSIRASTEWKDYWERDCRETEIYL